MSWFPVDDAFHGHPKARKAGFEAIGLWTVSGSYCMAYLTDGFVPEWFVKEKPRGTTLAKRLIDAGLWRSGVNDEGEPGFWFHDWKKECTKEHVLAEREKARVRKAKSRESHQESHRDIPRDDRRESRDMSGTNPTQPNPTQEKNSGCEPSKSPVSRSTNARGTRLPDGWDPPDSVIAQMRSDHPQIDLRAEHAKFTDHWRGKAGRDARKADWPATWRNWIRRAAEQQPTRNGHRNGTAIATSDLRVAQTQALKTAPPQRLELT